MTLSDKIRKREERKKQESDRFHTLVGENLRRLRLKHNYTQEYLAEIIGRKNYSSYGKIESGDARLSIEDAAVLSKLYNLSMEEMLFPQPDEERSSAAHEDRVTYVSPRSFLDITVRLDGTEVSLVKQIKLLERVNQVLSEA